MPYKHFDLPIYEIDKKCLRIEKIWNKNFVENIIIHLTAACLFIFFCLFFVFDDSLNKYDPFKPGNGRNNLGDPSTLIFEIMELTKN